MTRVPHPGPDRSVIFWALGRCSSVNETRVIGAPLGDPHQEVPSDAVLIAAVRSGDVDAYGELFARHVAAARRLARSLTRDGEADDLVSEAFAKVLVVLQRGDGPDTALRPYLLTSLRRLHVDHVRALARTRPTDDIAAYDAGEAFRDTAVAGFERGAAARAFVSLPERWQLVLWHLEVEGQKPADIAPLLGISPNSVSALAYRAREGLRQAFISMHAQDTRDEQCTVTRAQLGAFIRNDISKREGAAVEAHLRDCRECAAIYLELLEVNSNLRALVGPIFLGGAATAYLGSGAVAGGTFGVLTNIGDFLGKSWGKALAGTAAASVVVAAVVAGVQTPGNDDEVSADGTPAVSADPVPATEPHQTDRTTEPGPAVGAGPSPAPTAESSQAEPDPDPTTAEPDTSDQTQEQSDEQTDEQTDEATEEQTDEATDEATDEPADGPTDEPTAEPTPNSSDAEITSSAKDTGGLVWDVTIVVTGLAPTEASTLTVTMDRPAVGAHLDPRCDVVNVGSLTCRLDGSGTVHIMVTPVPGAPTTVTAVLAPSDRRTSVRLG